MSKAKLARAPKRDRADRREAVKRVDPRVERSKRLVLEAASRLIWERGPAAFRVEAVVERTGVALTTIYRHWPTRKDLLGDAIRAMGHPGPLPETGSLRGDLIEFFAMRPHKLQQRPWDRSLDTLAGIIEAGRHDPEISVIVASTVKGLLSSLKAMLARGQAKGEVRTDRQVDVMADILLGAVLIRRGCRGQEASDRYIEELVDTMMDAFGTGPVPAAAAAAGARAAPARRKRPARTG